MTRPFRIFSLTTLVLSLLVISQMPSPVHAASSEESLYKRARDSYHSLRKTPAKKKYRHNWIRVIENYRKVFHTYPGGRRGDDSLYMTGKLYSDLNAYSKLKDDLESSNEFFNKLIKSYPKSNLADDACFMVGRNYEKLGDNRRAYESYIIILEKYSKGDMFKKAAGKADLLKAYAPPPPQAADLGSENTAVSAGTKSIKNGKASHVTDIRHWSNPNYTRIVVDLDKEATYKSHLLRRDPSIGKPPRLYIDIFGASKKGAFKEEIPIHDGLLKRARAAQHDNDTVRVVLDIESIKSYKVFPMFDPFRIIIDVIGESSLRAPTIEALLQGDAKDRKSLKEALEDEDVSLSRQLGLGIRKIVVDAGHGGKDPGAIGPGGTKEKDVTLAIARALKKKLENSFSYKVVLTRDSDRYLRLEERTAIANMENADLFISIHANATRNRKAYGIETYVMNARASNRYAAEVAARENAVTSNRMGEFGSVLESILVDMQKTNKINESNKLASSVQSSMKTYLSKRYTRIRDLGVKQGPFYVLIGANMPSILAEVGFVSNRSEEKRLRDDKYIENLAAALALGIEKYSDIIKTASR